MLLLIVLLLNTGLSLATEHKDFGTYIIACHTSDFECFKRQYKAFRDNVFLGNDKFVIDLFEPFIFKYGHSGTCIMLSGVHKSELVAVSLNSITNEYMITLKMPLKIQQLKEVDENNVTRFCSQIDKNFRDIAPDNGKLNSFTGNVTVKVSYPCQIQRKKYSYLFLEEEDVDLILDIPDLSHFKDSPGEKGRLYQMSEWAYDVVQYIDVADLVLLPYTQRIRTAYERIPLEKFLLLYPEEQYSNVNFSFSDLKD